MSNPRNPYNTDSPKGPFDKMTLEQAKEIRTLRCVDGYTWRSVARVVHNLGWFGEFTPPGNQIHGAALCEKAASLLGENGREWPWN